MSPTHLRPFGRALLVLPLFGAVASFVCAQPRLSQDDYVRFMGRGLDRVVDKMEGSTPHRLRFSANLFFAHGAAVKYFDTETLLKYVDALKEGGAERIDLNPGLFPWFPEDEENVAKYDRLVKHIRAQKLELALNPEYNRGARTYKRFSEWEKDALELYAELGRRYRPDIFVLVHEPTTMAARMGLEASPGEWRSFVERAAEVVRKASPGSRLGAGGLAKEMEYFREFLAVDALEIMTINIYDLKDLQRNNRMIQMARRKGKAVYIAETWRSPHYRPRAGHRDTLETVISTGVGNRAFQDLDVRWLEALSAYASGWGLEAITPFWTQTFFLYVDDDAGALDWAYNSRVIQAIAKGERTETFRAYRRLARRYSSE